MKLIIIIPVYNEEKSIAKAIGSIFSSGSFIAEIRLVIVASGCTDNTVSIIKKFIFDGYPVTLIEEVERSGKANALNNLMPMLTSLEAGMYVFTDGDVCLTNKTIESIVSFFDDNPGFDVVTGHPVPMNANLTAWGKIADENCSIWNDVRSRMGSHGRAWPLSGYLFAVLPSCLPFHIPNNFVAEDAYIGLSLLQNGKKLGYSQSAIVNVQFPTTISDYYSQKSRTRAGWSQLSVYSPQEYKSLIKLQRQVVTARARRGNPLSLLCWLIDRGIMLVDSILSKKTTDRHLWDSVKSTKL